MNEVETFRRIVKKRAEEVEDFVIEMLLENAKQDICLYLNTNLSDERFTLKVMELAIIRFWKSQVFSQGLKSQTYTENVLTESSTFLTAEEYQAQENALFQKLNCYRKVRPHV